MLVECTVENTRLLGCMHAGNCYELASCMQSLWIWIYVHSAQCKQPRTHTTIASSNYRGEKGAQSYEGINIFILNSTVTHHIALIINRLSYTFVWPPEETRSLVQCKQGGMVVSSHCKQARKTPTLCVFSLAADVWSELPGEPKLLLCLVTNVIRVCDLIIKATRRGGRAGLRRLEGEEGERCGSEESWRGGLEGGAAGGGGGWIVLAFEGSEIKIMVTYSLHRQHRRCRHQ